MALREESAFYKRTVPLSAFVYVSFSILDANLTNEWSLWQFALLRAVAVAISCLTFLVLRGRSKYVFRASATTFPVTMAVTYIAIRFNLAFSPYFAGIPMVLTATLLQFQLRFKHAMIVNTLLSLPLIVWMTVLGGFSGSQMLLGVMMTAGAVIITSILCDVLHTEILSRFAIQERLARESGRRHKIIDEKVAEILNRKALEHQFAPQVLRQVINQPRDALDMRHAHVSVLVLDIENSTGKSTQLDPSNYKAVIEEAFDLFASACLKWDLTLDKFTGDGAQAFSGAPIAGEDDRGRAISAGLDFLRMLSAKSAELSVLWKGELRARLAITSGSALVGFVGRGRIRSFTVIGETVSLTHRLCGAASPNSLCVANEPDRRDVPPTGSIVVGGRVVGNLKGFGTRQFPVTEYAPAEAESESLDLGRCETCNTPLTLLVDSNGITDVACPACRDEQESGIAA